MEPGGGRGGRAPKWPPLPADSPGTFESARPAVALRHPDCSTPPGLCSGCSPPGEGETRSRRLPNLPSRIPALSAHGGRARSALGRRAVRRHLPFGQQPPPLSRTDFALSEAKIKVKIQSPVFVNPANPEPRHPGVDPRPQPHPPWSAAVRDPQPGFIPWSPGPQPFPCRDAPLNPQALLTLGFQARDVWSGGGGAGGGDSRLKGSRIRYQADN